MFLACEDGVLTEYSGREAHLTIPDSVKHIDAGVFAGNLYLKEVDFPDGLITVGAGAFGGCCNLRRAMLPETVRKIGHAAFSGCSKLAKVKIPAAVSEIGLEAFAGTAWLSRKLGKFVTVGDGVLLRCRANSNTVTLPKGIRHIAGGAFQGLPRLMSIDIPEGVQTIGEGAFADCTALQSITLPSTLRRIGRMAFSGCDSLTDIDIPEGVRELPELTFRHCTALRRVTLPAGMTAIGEGAFLGCKALTEPYFPEMLRCIGPSAFAGCECLEKLAFPFCLELVDSGAFEGCIRLARVHCIGDNTEIGERAFAECERLVGAALSKRTKHIGAEAFRNCIRLPALDLPEELTEIGRCAFQGCSRLGAVRFPSALRRIGDWAYRDCTSLRTVSGGANLQSVPANAFEKTPWLEQFEGVYQVVGEGILLRYHGQERRVELPDFITQITDGAFAHCAALPEELVLHDGVVRIGTHDIPGLRLTLVRGRQRVTVTLSGESEDKKLVRFWETKSLDERQIIMESIRIPGHKCPLLLLMALTEQKHPYFQSACRIAAPEMAEYFIREGEIDLLSELLGLGYIAKQSTDRLIGLAIAHAQETGDAEPQVLLMHYKSEHIGYEPLEDLMANMFRLD